MPKPKAKIKPANPRSTRRITLQEWLTLRNLQSVPSERELDELRQRLLVLDPDGGATQTMAIAFEWQHSLRSDRDALSTLLGPDVVTGRTLKPLKLQELRSILARLLHCLLILRKQQIESSLLPQ